MNLRDIYQASHKVENMSMNELRAILYQNGVEYTAKESRAELEKKVKQLQGGM